MIVYILFGIAVVLNVVALIALVKEYLIGRITKRLVMRALQSDQQPDKSKRSRRKVRHER